MAAIVHRAVRRKTEASIYACFTGAILEFFPDRGGGEFPQRRIRLRRQHREYPMVFVTAMMALATLAFYGASNYGIGADQLCYYGATFCVHPHWLAIATLMLAIWTLFLRVDRI
jgi:hypothetical protein